MEEAPRRRILVVDDDRVFCEMVKEWLGSEYQLDIAHDGEEGLRMAQARRPDLVLLDVMMPRLSGYSVAWVFKNDARYRGIPVIFVTAHATTPEARKRLEKADGHLLKPFPFESLSQVLSEHLPQALFDLGLPVPGADAAATDQRLSPRVAVEVPARIESAMGQADARIVSLSLRGAYVECELPMPQGATVTVGFEHEAGSFRAVAAVLYIAQRDGRTGLGLEFSELTTDEETVLSQVLGGADSGRPITEQ